MGVRYSRQILTSNLRGLNWIIYPDTFLIKKSYCALMSRQNPIFSLFYWFFYQIFYYLSFDIKNFLSTHLKIFSQFQAFLKPLFCLLIKLLLFNGYDGTIQWPLDCKIFFSINWSALFNLTNYSNWAKCSSLSRLTVPWHALG